MSTLDEAAWLTSLAAARGMSLAPGRALEIENAVTPILAAFRVFAAELHVEDDVHEFRRRLVQAAASNR